MSKKLFFFLWLLCIAGSLSVIPYMMYAGMVPPTLFNSGMILVAGFYGLICWFSYKLVPKTDLKPFQKSNFIVPGIGFGILIGLGLYLCERVFFHHSTLSNVEPPPFWTGALASLYGAVNEEVLLRLFFFTLLYFLFRKISDRRTIVLWGTNLFVATLFGALHLPAADKLIPLTAYEVSRILILNGAAGLVFGWIYWSRGLWCAMVAHFVADLMIHGFLVL